VEPSFSLEEGMIECLILGDSIAVGIQQHRIECASYAHVGWTSEKWNRTYLNKDLSAQVVVISLGSNDWSEKVTKYELMRLREKVRADLVFWILPAIKPEIRNVVREVADMRGDLIVPITDVSKDGVHPTSAGYRELARMVR
jgi:hypothetical protein